MAVFDEIPEISNWHSICIYIIVHDNIINPIPMAKEVKMFFMMLSLEGSRKSSKLREFFRRKKAAPFYNFPVTPLAMLSSQKIIQNLKSKSEEKNEKQRKS